MVLRGNLIRTKMKKYLKLTITRYDGSTFINPLKLSEVHLISKASQENKSILVELKEMDSRYYKLTFGV